MAAAGITPESIDIVLITHFHGDHIQGIRSKAGDLVYPNAAIMVPDKEWDYWMDDARAAANTSPQLQISFAASRRVFGPIANKVIKFAWGQEIVPGLTSVAVPGHAPGMSGFLLVSGGEKLLVQADVTNLPALFMRHPGWHLAFDMDPIEAEATRRRVFDMASSERILVSGYHYPFPAIGHISKQPDGYDLHLVTWRAKV
jgi:glyoxylase-like metal-dependent hydrolase (beta-lactamase superfamily II)